MNYVVGEEIVLADKQASSGQGPQPLNAANIKRKARSQYFEQGFKYTLYNIRPLPTGEFEYTFQRSDKQLIHHTFPSIKAAENVIANAKGESAPSHDGYYNNL